MFSRRTKRIQIYTNWEDIQVELGSESIEEP